jgi:CARDB
MKGIPAKALLALLLIAASVVASVACGPGTKFELGSLNISPTQTVKDSSFVVSVDVTNAGKADGNFEAKLKIDNALKETKTVSVAVGSTETVSFTVTADTAGTHTIKINDLSGTFDVLTPPQFANLVISPAEATVGEPVTVSADITNDGQISGNYTITLRVNDADEETKTVAIGAGEMQTAAFVFAGSASGTYSISLGGLSGTLTVLKPAGFAMSNLVISPAQAVAGREVTIMCDVTNTGEVNGTCPVNLKVDDVQVDSKQVTIAAGATQTVAFSLVKDTGGNYSIAIGDLSGTLAVSQGVLPTLHIGDQWVYREISGGIAYTVTEKIVGEELFQGVDCWIDEWTYDPVKSGISKETFWLKKATLDALRSQYSIEVSGITLTCSAAVESTYSGNERWPIKVGNEWTENGTITIVYEALGDSDTETTSYSMHYKVEKIENITVGAGTLRCFKIVTYQNGVATDAYWYSDRAKNYVRIDDLSAGESKQLLSYSVK